ncbi:MAG: sigma-70 family RNA polymerase sigma factor [Myxococcales bacterium]|nr:sigma-70 family RNA polymerase sigma factor [Myxococcales bacterium]MDD9967538.1 sigma-70 family RNA polymerase sigma factor [Myxococcales bacterium]
MNPLSGTAGANLAGAPEVPEWIRRASRGDARAQERLVREQWPRAEGLLRRMLGPRQDLEDLLQTVFLETFRALPRYEGRSQLSTFVGGISVRVAMRAMRTQRRSPARAPLPEHLAAPDRGPEHQAHAADLLRRVRELLAELTEVKRCAFTLWALSGLSVPEIAELMEASVPATRSRIFYAQRELRALANDQPELQDLLGGNDGRA